MRPSTKLPPIKPAPPVTRIVFMQGESLECLAARKVSARSGTCIVYRDARTRAKNCHSGPDRRPAGAIQRQSVGPARRSDGVRGPESSYDRRNADPAIRMRSLKSFLAQSAGSFWLLQICGWTGYFVLNFSAMLAEGKHYHYVWYSLGSTASGFAVTSVLRLGYRRVWNLPAPKMTLSAAAMLLVALIIDTKLYTECLFQVCDDCRPHNLLGYTWYFVSRLYVLLSWSGLYFGIKFSRQLREQKEAALKAQAMAHEAQLKMLRYQLNPHFLFNTLNAISTLVLDRKWETANHMVGSLSAFLRYSLDSDPVQRVTLAQEIDATNQYLGIEQLRFGERLRVRIDVAGDAREALVPSLILQPLIENAIKYAVSRREEGGSIE